MKTVRFAGRIWKDGRWWLAEVPALDAMTQGRTRKKAMEMIADYIETAVNRPRFKVSVIDTDGAAIAVESADVGAMVALMLRRIREASGVTLAEVAKRLGQRSPNAYARYEQGSSTPTVDKLAELVAAIEPGRTLELRWGPGQSMKHRSRRERKSFAA